MEHFSILDLPKEILENISFFMVNIPFRNFSDFYTSCKGTHKVMKESAIVRSNIYIARYGIFALRKAISYNCENLYRILFKERTLSTPPIITQYELKALLEYDWEMLILRDFLDVSINDAILIFVNNQKFSHILKKCKSKNIPFIVSNMGLNMAKQINPGVFIGNKKFQMM